MSLLNKQIGQFKSSKIVVRSKSVNYKKENHMKNDVLNRYNNKYDNKYNNKYNNQWMSQEYEMNHLFWKRKKERKRRAIISCV